ncbi:MAG: hypothetical protein M5U12_20470 [Verrucomicrobia bacterium]|nr:hypothetical protein [Verrucomicrobiota bacterium]
MNDEPVVARPPSAAYRFQKAFRRHKVAFTAAGAVAVSLLLGIAVSLWQAAQAYQARREALDAKTEAVAAGANEQVQRYVAEQEKLNAERATADAERLLYAANMNLARLAFEENNFARLRQILQQTADDPNRGFEWYYWQRQAHLELKTLRGHLAPVVAVAFSPDGRRLVTGSYDNTARVWDAEQGAELIALHGHDHEVKAVAFSPDGQLIVTGSADRTVRLWDAATGQRERTLEGHEHWVTSVAFSPHGRWIVSGSLDGTARLYEADSGRWLHTFPHGERVWSVAFSGDGQWVLTGGGDEVARVWNANTGEAMSPRIEAPTARMEARGDRRGFTPFTAVFVPDSRLIIAGSRDQTVGVWERVSGRELFRLQGKAHWLSPLQADVPLALAVSPDGERLVTGRLDRTADVWALAGRTNRFTLRGHEAEIAAVAISPDGRRIATGSFDHTAKIWDATRSRESMVLDGGHQRAHQGRPSDGLLPGRPAPGHGELGRDGPGVAAGDRPIAAPPPARNQPVVGCRLFSRWPAADHRRGRWGAGGLGLGDRHAGPDAPRCHGLGNQRRVLSRWPADSHRARRSDRPDLGCSHRSCAVRLARDGSRRPCRRVSGRRTHCDGQRVHVRGRRRRPPSASRRGRDHQHAVPGRSAGLGCGRREEAVSSRRTARWDQHGGVFT